MSTTTVLVTFGMVIPPTMGEHVCVCACPRSKSLYTETRQEIMIQTRKQQKSTTVEEEEKKQRDGGGAYLGESERSLARERVSQEPSCRSELWNFHT